MLTLECANKTLCQNYTEIYCRLYRYGTALTEEQLGQREILRRIRLRALLRMTSLSGAQQSVLPRRLNTVVFLWKTVRPDGQVRNMG